MRLFSRRAPGLRSGQRAYVTLCAAASCAMAFGASVVTPLSAQTTTPFATRVIAFDTKGQAGGGVFNPSNALGAPGTFTNLHSLGNGGSLTLGFAVTITNGPGADLLVAENPFRSTTMPNKTFAEVAFVEVSSNGRDFARFSSRYMGTQNQPGNFDFVEVGHYSRFAGVLPVDINAADLQDVVEAGGDAFDLDDLRNHPLVLGGRVDLSSITQVRLVDVQSGIDRDARNVLVRDPSSGSADINAVTVVQHTGNQSPRGPSVDIMIPTNGRFRVRVSDPDGIMDIDPASLRAAVWGAKFSFADLISVSRVINLTPNGFTLELLGSLPSGFPLQLSVSLKDRAGHRSGDSEVRPLN